MLYAVFIAAALIWLVKALGLAAPVDPPPEIDGMSPRQWRKTQRRPIEWY